MSKKKKGKNEQKQISKPKQTNLKGVNKHEKTKFKHTAKQSKIKNKQNIRHSVLSKSKGKQNIKDNVMSKSKNKNNIKGNAASKAKSKQNIKDVKITKKDKLLKRLNVNRLSTMLLEKEKATGEMKKKKLQEAPLSLRERMMAQLKASRFRYLNEQLYSSDSSQSKKYFEEDPDAFYAYHEGYKQQVDRWPMNPLDVIIESIKKMYVPSLVQYTFTL